jgi:hypothetical protein
MHVALGSLVYSPEAKKWIKTRNIPIKLAKSGKG